MVGIRISVAERAGIEVAAGGREGGRFALPDCVEVYAVKPGLETFRLDGDFNLAASPDDVLDEIRSARDSVAGDVGMRPHRNRFAF
jgi:hypothetical protein